MFQLNTFHLWSKKKIILFTKHMRIKSRSSNLIRTRDLSRSIPLPLIFRVWICSFGIWALLFSTSFFLFYSLFPFNFLSSLPSTPPQLPPASHRTTWWCRARSARFFLFLYPYPIGTAFESIENLFFCMNRYYYIPISSRYLPRKIPNWIQNWRVSVSLSMRLCTLQIGIHFLKDPGFRALVSRPRSFRWPMLCWRDIYMIRSIA